MTRWFVEEIQAADFEKFKDYAEKNFDWIVAKLEKYDQEYTIISSKYPEFSDKLDDHEKRVKFLEKKTTYKTS